MGGAGKAVTSVDFSWSVLSDRKQVQVLEFLLPCLSVVRPGA